MKKALIVFILSNFVFINIHSQSPFKHTGIYTLGKLNQPLNKNTYSKPYVIGGAIRVTWKKLEPTENNYDWSFIRSEIKTAKNTGKKISIFIKTDFKGTPDWVYKSGAKKYYYTDKNKYHKTYGDTLFFPIPYDTIYLKKWLNFIHYFGLEFGNEDTISFIRGASESVTNGWNLPKTDIQGNDWKHYNYTPKKLITAMKTVLDKFMVSFPKTPHWVEIGNIKFESKISGKSKLYVSKNILNYGLINYPKRMGIWREDLNCNIPLKPENSFWKIIQDNPCITGVQLLANVSRKTGLNRMRKCNNKFTANKALKAALEMADYYSIPYIEVYKVDILNKNLHHVLSR